MEKGKGEVRKSRRGFLRHTSNPFLGDVELSPGRKKRIVMKGKPITIIDHGTGEQTTEATEIVKYVQADPEEFVKVYTRHLKAFFDLTGTGFRVLQYVLKALQQYPNADRLTLHFMEVQELVDDKMAESTFFAGMKELLQKGFIAESMVPNTYFINPALFFNGRRETLFTTRISQTPEKSKDAENRDALEAKGQQRLVD